VAIALRASLHVKLRVLFPSLVANDGNIPFD